MKLIFELSEKGRVNSSQSPVGHVDVSDIPASLLRAKSPALPEVSFVILQNCHKEISL